jgi:hypothetical protein
MMQSILHPVIALALIFAVTAVGACSERTGNHAEEAVESAGETAGSAAEDTGDNLEEAGDEADEALGDD